MGRDPAANQDQRERAQAALVAAAARLFAEHGIEAVSVAQIARAAGVSKGLLYHYFETKEALVDAVVQRRIAELGAIARDLPAEGSPAARLRAIAHALLAHADADPEGFRLLLRVLTHPASGEAVRAAVQARAPEFQARADGFAALFAALGAEDPALEARFFQATMLGLLVLHTTSPLPGDPKPLIAHLLRAVGAGGLE